MFILSKRTNQYAICCCKAFPPVINLDFSSRVLAKVSIGLTYFPIAWTLLKKHTLFLVLENSNFAIAPSSFLHGEPDLPRFCCPWIWFMSWLGLVLDSTGTRDLTRKWCCHMKSKPLSAKGKRTSDSWLEPGTALPPMQTLSLLSPPWLQLIAAFENFLKEPINSGHEITVQNQQCECGLIANSFLPFVKEST